MKFGCAICIFLNSANLICRSMDISKCFRESLQLRDNESRLYKEGKTKFHKRNLRKINMQLYLFTSLTHVQAANAKISLHLQSRQVGMTHEYRIFYYRLYEFRMHCLGSTCEKSNLIITAYKKQINRKINK